MIMMTAMLALVAMASANESPVLLQRTSKPGEKLNYSVKSRLITETQTLGSETFMPSIVEIDYGFIAEATNTKPDGIFDFRYKRPVMNVDEGGKKTVEKTDFDLMITLSPINEFLEVKDLAPKKPPTKAGGNLNFMNPSGSPQDAFFGGFIGQFVGEIQRLALFIGSLDSSIDFQPKLDFREVAKGDTWRRTVSFSPQKLETKGNKTVMQRLDYVYTYEGLVDSGGSKVHRVVATLEMDSNLLQFMKDNVDLSRVSVHFNEISFKLKARIEFDLDAKTGHTLKAEAKSEGGFKIVAAEYPDDPYVEQKLRGTTVMRLVSRN